MKSEVASGNKKLKRGIALMLSVLLLSTSVIIADGESTLTRIYDMLNESIKEPTTWSDYYELASVAIGQREYDAALAHLEQARKLAEASDAPTLAELWLKTASIYALTGDTVKALSGLDEALRQDPASPQALLLRAQLFIESADYAAAIRDLKAYMLATPGDLTTGLTLAQLLENTGDYVGAKEQYRTLYAANSQDESYLLNALRCEFLEGNYDRALTEFDEYLKDETKQQQFVGVASFLRAACLMQLGRYAEAQQGYEAAITAGYDEITCKEQMLLCSFEQEDYETAVQLGEALEAHVDALASPDLFYQRLGAALMQLERYDEALQRLSLAMEKNPELAGNAYYRGVTLLSLGRYEEAIVDFTTSIEQAFLPQFCYYNRGVCQVQLVHYEQAVDDMSMTLKAGDDAALNEAARNVLWQLAAYYEQQATAAPDTNTNKPE